MKTRKLSRTQVSAFDRENIEGKRWELVKGYIEHEFANRSISFLDIGGGNGLFADKILDNYPGASGTILDNSEYLLQKNRKHSRKYTILESVDNIEKVLREYKFDIIFMHWFLHHGVSDSYRETTVNVINLLTLCTQYLAFNGKISVFEIMYDGILFDDLPSHLIYRLTSSTMFSKIANKMGSNTAGVGVCFRSKRNWLDIMRNSGLQLIEYWDDEKWDVTIPRRLFLHMGNIRSGHFWLAKK